MFTPLVVNEVTFKQWQIGSSSPKVYRTVAFTLNPAVTTIRQRVGYELVTTERCLVAGVAFTVSPPAGWVGPPATPLSEQFTIDGFPAILAASAVGPHIVSVDGWTTNDAEAEPNGLSAALYGATGLGVAQ